MNEILEIVKYTLPSVIVFATAYYLVKSFFEKEDKKRLIEVSIGNQKLLTPLRLQAYERIVLFLERISPDNMAIRLQQSGMPAKQLQMQMLNSIRSEFEHNLSQQIYMGQATWEAVISAKESIVKLVNAASMRMPENASAIDLSRMMLEMYLSVDQPPVTSTIFIIKQELNETFGILK